MISTIFEDIQRHLSLLDLALASSIKITSLAKNENLDGLVNETDNRERLVNLIGQFQQAIENQINQINAAELSSNDINILKTWFEDLANWSEKMIEQDRLTVELLAQQKESTTKEIAVVYKNKESLKGYNHSAKK
jgi:hypothetical protein